MKELSKRKRSDFKPPASSSGYNTFKTYGPKRTCKISAFRFLQTVASAAIFLESSCDLFRSLRHTFEWSSVKNWSTDLPPRVLFLTSNCSVVLRGRYFSQTLPLSPPDAYKPTVDGLCIHQKTPTQEILPCQFEL
jgi:hypothetical protein